MTEIAVQFGRDQNLVGVISEPQEEIKAALIWLNAGMIHHVGPNRIYVKVARRLIDSNFLSLRFDLSATGDSFMGPNDMGYFEQAICDIEDAVEYIQNNYKKIDKIILVGFCASTTYAIKIANQYSDIVKGLVLLNPNSEVLDRYLIRCNLLNLNYWKKTIMRKGRTKTETKAMINGLVLGKEVSEVSLDELRAQIEEHGVTQLSELQSLVNSKIQTLVVCSQLCYSLDHMHMLLKQLHEANPTTGNITARVIPGASHALYVLQDYNYLLGYLEEWLLGNILGTSDKKDKRLPSHRAFGFLKNLNLG